MVAARYRRIAPGRCPGFESTAGRDSLRGMSETSQGALDTDELVRLVTRVFAPKPADQRLLIITDLPDDKRPDRAAWSARRGLALDWARRLEAVRDKTGIAARLALYRNVGANNADLPEQAWIHALDQPLPATADQLDAGAAVAFGDELEATQLVIAPTELSTTAPLKLAARRSGLRAATMPGFSPAMLPALRLDYGEIDRRVKALAALLTKASGATLRFVVDRRQRCELRLDLRWRTAHASSGLLTEPGTAGNLPSGEAYIVPYEGERPDAPSRSQGTLPVQLEGEVVLYRIERGRALAATGGSRIAKAEAEKLADEPAYGNLAELGLGVLGGFGVRPVGEVLLDEKLGPHIAFGRSDHFGGQVGPAHFRKPQSVVHIDRVYLPETQPRVRLESIELEAPDSAPRQVWRRQDYVRGIFDAP